MASGASWLLQGGEFGSRFGIDLSQSFTNWMRQAPRHSLQRLVQGSRFGTPMVVFMPRRATTAKTRPLAERWWQKNDSQTSFCPHVSAKGALLPDSHAAAEQVLDGCSQ